MNQPHGYAPPGYGPPNQSSGKSPKSWVSTLLLSILLGGLGVHAFYAGRGGLGIARLALWAGTVVVAIMGALEGGILMGVYGILIVAQIVWWVVDLVLIVTGKYRDGNGLPIKN